MEQGPSLPILGACLPLSCKQQQPVGNQSEGSGRESNPVRCMHNWLCTAGSRLGGGGVGSSTHAPCHSADYYHAEWVKQACAIYMEPARASLNVSRLAGPRFGPRGFLQVTKVGNGLGTKGSGQRHAI